MERSKRLNVTIVNRNYPPSKGIISESPSDLAKHFVDKGFNVHIVHTDGSYAGGGGMSEVVGTVHKVKAFYNGKNKLIRLMASMVEGYLLIAKARKINKGTIIVMTAPALLNFWASKLLRKKNIPWVYWSMDLFPEAFVAGKLITKSNPIYKYFHKESYSYAPEGLLALGEIQATFLEEKFNKKIDKVILPCGILLHQKNNNKTSDSTPEWKNEEHKIYLGYVGNLGEAHSVEFIKWVIDNLDHERQHLILVLYGSKAQEVKNYIKDKEKGITLLDHIPRAQLKHIDLHLVSLEPEWVNLCVPSKLLSAVHKSSVFLFFGTAHCDSWQYLQRAGWLIEKDNDAKEKLKKFLQSLSKEQIDNKRKDAASMPQLLQEKTVEGYDNIVELVKKINNKDHAK